MSAFRTAAMLMAAEAALTVAPSARSSPGRSGRAACVVAKVRVAALLHRPLSRVPFCDTVRDSDVPRGFYLVVLHGRCREEICGSTLIGWYAVQRSSGRVFEWDVGESRLGKPLTPGT